MNLSLSNWISSDINVRAILYTQIANREFFSDDDLQANIQLILLYTHFNRLIIECLLLDNVYLNMQRNVISLAKLLAKNSTQQKIDFTSQHYTQILSTLRKTLDSIPASQEKQKISKKLNEISKCFDRFSLELEYYPLHLVYFYHEQLKNHEDKKFEDFRQEISKLFPMHTFSPYWTSLTLDEINGTGTLIDALEQSRTQEGPVKKWLQSIKQSAYYPKIEQHLNNARQHFEYINKLEEKMRKWDESEKGMTSITLLGKLPNSQEFGTEHGFILSQMVKEFEKHLRKKLEKQTRYIRHLSATAHTFKHLLVYSGNINASEITDLWEQYCASFNLSGGALQTDPRIRVRYGFRYAISYSYWQDWFVKLNLPQLRNLSGSRNDE